MHARTLAVYSLACIATACILALAVSVPSACSSSEPSGSSAATQALGTTTSTTASTTTPAAAASTTQTSHLPSPITFTDVYDNQSVQSGLKADWGFSCLVQGYEQTVLFDTGAGGRLLLTNLDALGIQVQEIDVVVLSHQHSDHTAGLASLLDLNPDITVYCPASFSASFTRAAERLGATVVRVDHPFSICPGVTMASPLPGGSVKELGLLLETAGGPVLITGCAHPGIVQMVESATTLAGRPLVAVLGGFHLYQKSGRSVDAVIAQLKELGVRQCGPSHCTGAGAVARFAEAFGSDFIRMGVGAVVQF